MQLANPFLAMLAMDGQRHRSCPREIRGHLQPVQGHGKLRQAGRASLRAVREWPLDIALRQGLSDVSCMKRGLRRTQVGS